MRTKKDYAFIGKELCKKAITGTFASVIAIILIIWPVVLLKSYVLMYIANNIAAPVLNLPQKPYTFWLSLYVLVGCVLAIFRSSEAKAPSDFTLNDLAQLITVPLTALAVAWSFVMVFM